jgi:peptidylprolyl isomerase
MIFALAGTLAAAQSSTTPAPKPATAKPAGTAAAKTGTAAKSTTATKSTTAAKTGTATAGGPKLPPGIPPVKGIVKPLFTLRYQDIKIGTGAVAEPLKLYKVKYTGWLASDGTKFDSSDDHRRPETDKDGKPVMDADGKPKLGEAEPIQFPQGRGRVIPGWDQGFEGMKIGGKRRLFIPYQLAYGAAGRPPKIPAKSDLIFDVELVDITDLPAPGMPGGGRPMPGMPRPAAPNAPAAPATPPAPNAPSSSASPSAPAAPTAAPAPSAPATPPAPDKPVNPEQPK